MCQQCSQLVVIVIAPDEGCEQGQVVREPLPVRVYTRNVLLNDILEEDLIFQSSLKY